MDCHAVTVIIRLLKMSMMQPDPAANVIRRMKVMKKFRSSQMLFTDSAAAVTRHMAPDHLKKTVLCAMSDKLEKHVNAACGADL